VRKLVGWLAARAPQWTIVVRGQHVGALDGFVPSYVMPALLLTTAPPRPSPPAGVTIGLARDPAEFLAVYGADLAPLVTARHFAAAGHHHLIARIDAAPVGCARVRIHGGTAYVSAVTVLQPYRRRGIGAALSAAASRLGSAHADLVWLHAADHARAIYERLGYVQVDEHVQMAPAAGTV
jgi:ribosomal protein S18 acetylase RimI-like enzyme